MEALETTRRAVELLLRPVADAGRSLAVRAWDGTLLGDPGAAATIVLRHPGSLRALLLPPNDLTAGEAYVYDDVDIDGDIIEALRAAVVLRAGMRPIDRVRLLRLLRRLPDDARRSEAVRPTLRGRLRHSKARDAEAIRHHYDVGNDFYRLFLDPRLVYSCAYFLDPDEPLEVAQERKLDLVCRKLGLRPGMRLLDVGCGWGALVVHAAERYGVEAVGVTISPSQASYARELVAARGLEGKVSIEELDYRDVTGTFDAIASIGMFEHVGAAKLGVYFGHLRELLAPGGVLLNHGITTRDRGRHIRRRPTFVNTYVFPDGELVPVERVVEQAERAGFEVRDAESLRMHYAHTLRRWVANLERHRAEAVALAGERTYRIWRLYMAGSSVGFEMGGLSVYQLVCADPAASWRWGRGWALAADDVIAPAMGTDAPTVVDLRTAEDDRDRRPVER